MNCKTMFFMIFLMSTNIQSMQQDDCHMVTVGHTKDYKPLTVGFELPIGIACATAMVIETPNLFHRDPIVRKDARHAIVFSACGLVTAASFFVANNLGVFFPDSTNIAK